MRIAILNKLDITGGAARAAYRLYLGLIAQGHDVDYLVQDKKSENNRIQKIETLNKHNHRRFLEKLTQIFYINANRTKVSNTFFSFTYSGANLAAIACLKDAELINLHWIEKLVSSLSLNQLVALNKPLVWTLHDERAFTGGCHYTAGCTGFVTDCSNCRQLRHDPFSIPKRALQAKAKVLEQANLTIVAPSQWLANEAGKSAIFRNKRIVVIPNSLETDIFTPAPKNQAKELLGIDARVVTLMFGAEDNKERRKGLRELSHALRLCLKNDRFAKACRDHEILIISAGSSGTEIKQLPIKLNAFGAIDDDRKMVALYNATEIFVLPSLEDNLPNMMLEAMACGTPVIGFHSGGIPDVVKHQENGLVVDKGNAQALAEAILELVFDKKKRNRFSRNCRVLMGKHYKLADQADNYHSLFEQLLGRNGEKKRRKFML